MGQGEILQFLQENEGQIFTSKEICLALDRVTASSSLLRLRKHKPNGFSFSKQNLLFNTFISNAYVYWFLNRF